MLAPDLAEIVGMAMTSRGFSVCFQADQHGFGDKIVLFYAALFRGRSSPFMICWGRKSGVSWACHSTFSLIITDGVLETSWSNHNLERAQAGFTMIQATKVDSPEKRRQNMSLLRLSGTSHICLCPVGQALAQPLALEQSTRQRRLRE